MGCRNCGAPLPDPAVQPTGACPHCGTLFGDRAELEEFAAAVLSGRPIERPESIATRRLKVRFDRGTAGDGSDASLVVTLRYFSASTLLGLVFALLALAGIGYIWYLALTAHVYAVASGATALLGLYVWIRITVVFDGLLVRVADGQLFCRQSRTWPRLETTLPIADIVQLYAVQTGRAFGLFALVKGDEAKLLVRNIGNPELAVYLERQIELALRLEDRAVQGELQQGAALPQRAPRVRPFVVEAVFISLFVIGPTFGIRTCGSWVAELDIGDRPHEVTFDLQKATTVFFTADMDLTHDHWHYRDDIPQVVTFDIELRQNGRPVSRLSCNPLDMDVWVSGAHNHLIDSFWGPMNRCAVKLPPGGYTLSAVQRWKPGAKHIAFEDSVLGVRGR